MTEAVLPQVFIDRLVKIAGEEFKSSIIKAISAPRPAIWRVNTLKTTPQEALAKIKDFDANISYKLISDNILQLNQKDHALLLESPLVAQGLLYAQGRSSLLAVEILDPKPGEHVLDLCAAPGSKTTYIALRMGNEGVIVANEPVRNRFFRLKAVVELMGAGVTLSMKDGRIFKPGLDLFDRVLVDAPCSSEGRFRLEEPESFAYWNARKIKEMSHKQKGLLLNASRLVKPGGVLVYATCTYAPEENEAVVDWFLRKSEGKFVIEPIEQDLPRQAPLLTWEKRTFDPCLQHTLRVMPTDIWEGFFITKFVCVKKS